MGGTREAPSPPCPGAVAIQRFHPGVRATGKVGMIMDLSELLASFLSAKLHIGNSTILWREIVGNGFGLASAILGMRRRVSAWPVGIVGNILLFTVFLGAVFDTPSDLNLYGQAGRQVFFLIVSVYGFIRWSQFKRSHGAEGVGVRPRWAGTSGRLQLLAGAIVGTA